MTLSELRITSYVTWITNYELRITNGGPAVLILWYFLTLS